MMGHLAKNKWCLYNAYLICHKVIRPLSFLQVCTLTHTHTRRHIHKMSFSNSFDSKISSRHQSAGGGIYQFYNLRKDGSLQIVV